MEASSTSCVRLRQLHNQLIRYKTESNIVLRGTKKGRFHFDPSAKFVWTNGVEWIVFKEAAFTRTACQKQGISDLFAAGEGDSYERYFMRFSFPKMRENLWDVQFENLSRELAPEWGYRTAAMR